ncbi:MAG: hypothetical protein A2Y20_07120 [Firmicutes bacterium GWF2_51_9]|nr:MAG: hypothetical protein A2Y20_07120 [Firmicutes bacterium GWF2_51_9]OGS58995.1 MAG: hypothetical protein A2Y19_07420 [Firmicutes bacterium GWE2_51_13]HAM62699.1 hypothetical protein [Erysipelotrichaceae bacterium]HAO61935.1 hypothetical protein [Erysipelotrichaceae bacterium]HBZ40570.1 hypothetical protein [Erysipelotrichaceae bacterium]
MNKSSRFIAMIVLVVSFLIMLQSTDILRIARASSEGTSRGVYLLGGIITLGNNVLVENIPPMIMPYLIVSSLLTIVTIVLLVFVKEKKN